MYSITFAIHCMTNKQINFIFPTTAVSHGRPELRVFPAIFSLLLATLELLSCLVVLVQPCARHQVLLEQEAVELGVVHQLYTGQLRLVHGRADLMEQLIVFVIQTYLHQ